MICGHCLTDCFTREVNEGIGGYEYWGCMGNDDSYSRVSVCCGDPVWEELSTAIDAQEIPFDEAMKLRGYDLPELVLVEALLVDDLSVGEKVQTIVEVLDAACYEARRRQ